MFELKLTKSQIENLAEFFEMEFISSIRRNEDTDNIHYIVEMCDIYKQLKEIEVQNNG